MVDNVHEIAGRIAEKETAKTPALLDWAVNHLCSSSANGGLGGVEIIDADGDHRQFCARAPLRGGVQLDLLGRVFAQKSDPTHVKGYIELKYTLVKHG